MTRVKEEIEHTHLFPWAPVHHHGPEDDLRGEGHITGGDATPTQEIAASGWRGLHLSLYQLRDERGGV